MSIKIKDLPKVFDKRYEVRCYPVYGFFLYKRKVKNK